MPGRRDPFRGNPFEDIEDLFERITRGFDQMNHDLESSPMGTGIHVDVLDDDEEIVVVADLPGYDTDDIDLTVDGRELRLHAERSAETESEESGRYHRRERRHEQVSRVVTLPAEVEEDAANATYRNGVLTVRMPKRSPDGTGQRIDIE